MARVTGSQLICRGAGEPGEPGSDITIITIYQLLSVCRADNRESIVLIFA
jgi:hypothetical protein